MSEANASPRRPGAPIASRPLHFIWLVDGSGSMRVQGKIEALNDAIRSAIPHMQRVARDNPQATIFVNAIRFGDAADWLVDRLTPVADFRWNDIKAGGGTAMGEALAMVGEALQPPLIRGRALPPIMVLVTDGLPTDDFQAGLDHLLSKTWGEHALRMVVPLGEDAATAEAQRLFHGFASERFRTTRPARNAEELTDKIRWAATAGLRWVCAPPTYEAGSPVAEEDSPLDHDPARDLW